MEEITVVGLGPGEADQITPAVQKALVEADVVAGYTTYLDLIAPLIEGKEQLATGMRRETERVDAVLAAAREGKRVCLVSSGDAGLYGMAGLLLERAGEEADRVTVLPGISSAFSSAALLGAPLMHDTVLLSLSDLLTEADLIRKRLRLAAEGDFVTVLYNPKSKKRTSLIREAQEIFLKYRSADTPVGIVRNGWRRGQETALIRLDEMGEHPLIDMLSTVIIGNSSTRIVAGKMVTPRGYERKND
ncbi:MAG: precorrin-3B C(17)-methyltransferase [Spirochaetales bacterium]|nr:precorrin-3B C(17)-methyltransferase [Spirochaetales bacterium]